MDFFAKVLLCNIPACSCSYLLTSMELILMPNYSVLHLHSNDMNV